MLRELKVLLDQIATEVETPAYVSDDPVQFIHAFEEKRDKEIAGFLAALMAWGRRDIVIRKTDDLLSRMNYELAAYVMHYSPARAEDFRTFRHRTFNQTDIHGFLSSLHCIYSEYEDFEAFWISCSREAHATDRPLLSVFHDRFLSLTPEFALRSRKHISTPESGSPCKRLNMFLRWAVRKQSPVDAGIWNLLPESELLVPLDVHVARQSRRLGLLTRRSNDWKAVLELTDVFRYMDPEDPSKYDFALFGLGALGHSLPPQFHLNAV